ncbi:MAG: aminopeptidase N, partial [Halieaceae bacterium]
MGLREGIPATILRADYRPPDFGVSHVELEVSIFDGRTEVVAALTIERKSAEDVPLRLDGEQLELQWVEIDGQRLSDSQYELMANQLVIPGLPDHCILRTCVEICPEENTSLEGFYRSQSAYCTQCEAEGFRKITFYPDRPDVLAVYTVTLEADQNACPVLLSNGNLISEEVLAGGRHRATWHD